MKIENPFPWQRISIGVFGACIPYLSSKTDSPNIFFIKTFLTWLLLSGFTLNFHILHTGTWCSFIIFSLYYLLFDDDEQNDNKTITECVVITMTATMLLRSLLPWHTLGFQWRYMYWYRYVICDVILLFHSTLPYISSMTNKTITEYRIVISV